MTSNKFRLLHRPRSAVSCQKSVFQTAKEPPSLDHIEDLLTRSYDMPSEQKAEYFLCHGVDLISVHKYYDTVKALNRSLQCKSSNPDWMFVLRLIVFYVSIVVS